MHRPAPTLKGRALMWLAQREHTRQELHHKLVRWVRAQQVRAQEGAAADADANANANANAPAEAPHPETAPLAGIEPLLDALQAAGHLSDQRFVESRVNARQGRFGNRRIEQELKRHGAALSAPMRAELRATEAERARQVWASRFGQRAANAQERARQMRFLAGRGFSAEVIRRVVNADPDADDPFDDPGDGA